MCNGKMVNGPDKRYAICGRCRRIDFEKYENDRCTRTAAPVLMSLLLCLALVGCGVGDDLPDAGDAQGMSDAISEGHDRCLFYQQQYAAYADVCGADGAEAARLEIQRISSRGCAAVVDVDGPALGECIAALESLTVSCTGPEDFISGAKSGPCPSVRWTVQP